MTPLRAQMIYQMQLERLAPKTQAAYVAAVAGLATFYCTSRTHSHKPLNLFVILL